MKIVLNTAASTWLGGRYYLENLARALSYLDGSERPQVVVNGDTSIPTDLAERVEGVPADADVVFPNWGLRNTGPVAQIHWIPDLQHRALPANFGRVERMRRDMGYRRLVEQARLVVVSSDEVRRDVGDAYRSALPKLRVLHFRTVIPGDTFMRDPRLVVDQYGLPHDYVLLPNQFWAHKNHALALEALDDLHLPLACTGEPSDHRRPGYAERLIEEARSRTAAERLFVLGVVPRDDYLQIVRAARAVLQPSLFEGWSSIVEDARALGKPIAVSDIPVHREQEPPRASFFDPGDPRAFARAVAEAVDRGSEPEEDASDRQAGLVREYAARFVAIAAEASGKIEK